MSKRDLLKDAVNAIAAGNLKLLNLRNVKRRTKNMKDPALVIPADSYQGAPNALAHPMCVETARLACAGHERPGFWEIGIADDDADTLTARPCLTESEATIPCKWDEQTGALQVDMLPLLLVRKVTVPKETSIRIPLSTTNVEGVGPVIMLHFGQISFHAVEKGKRKKKDDGTENNA